MKRAQDGFAGISLFFRLPFYLAHWQTIVNDSTLERRKRFAESTFRLMKTKGARARGRVKAKGWTFVRVCCLSKGIVVAFTCALVVRNGRTHSEREAARTIENNPPRRTKCRGRMWETRAIGQRCSLSDCTLPENEAQVHQERRKGKRRKRKRIIKRERELEKSNVSK